MASIISSDTKAPSEAPIERRRVCMTSHEKGDQKQKEGGREGGKEGQTYPSAIVKMACIIFSDTEAPSEIPIERRRVCITSRDKGRKRNLAQREARGSMIRVT